MTGEPATNSIQNLLARAFRTPVEAPAPRVLRTSSLHFSEFSSDDPKLVMTGSLPRDDAYVLTLHLRERPRGVMSAEGRYLDPKNFHAGHAGFVDLRMNLTSEYAGPFHYLTCYLPRAALNHVTDDAGAPRIQDLRYRPGVGFLDPVMHHLLLSVRPALKADPREISTLYADHVAMALVSHLASTYGELQLPRLPSRGGLTPKQQRRAKELLDARLNGAVSLAELADTCQLSVRHFSRAFRQSTGQSPHRWLLERRLDKARALLEGGALSLGDVAAACGFASQSHFTRAFTRALGASPGAWRRSRRV